MKKIPWKQIIDHLKKGTPTPCGDNSFDDWNADPENRKLYDDAQSLWNNVQYKASAYNPDKEKGWTMVSKKIREEVKTITISLRSLYRYSAAAVILLVAGIGFYVYNNQQSAVTPVLYKYASLNGKSKVTLPDGTAVWLGPRTEISYTNAFTPENRNVSIQGKAYFEVKKDSLHPFIVLADQSLIKVYGTSFNVNNSGNNLTVSLLTGKISFLSSKNATPQPVSPGEAITLDKRTGFSRIEKSDVFFDVIWAQDKLRIEEKNLGDVVKYLNQWYDAKITLDPALKDKYKFTFTVTNEQLDEILRMLSRINPMEITYNKDKVNIK